VEKEIECLSVDFCIAAAFRKVVVHEVDEFKFERFDWNRVSVTLVNVGTGGL
jgi:hypothetical protein